MSKGLFGKARLQRIYRRVQQAGETLLGLIRTRDFRSVYQEFWNRAHGIRDVTLRGVFSDRPVNSGLCDVKLIAYYVPWACPPTGTEPGSRSGARWLGPSPYSPATFNRGSQAISATMISA